MEEKNCNRRKFISHVSNFIKLALSRLRCYLGYTYLKLSVLWPASPKIWLRLQARTIHWYDLKQDSVMIGACSQKIILVLFIGVNKSKIAIFLPIEWFTLNAFCIWLKLAQFLLLIHAFWIYFMDNGFWFIKFWRQSLQVKARHLKQKVTRVSWLDL